jgi:hypothetical protein
MAEQMPTHKPQMTLPTQSIATFWEAAIKMDPMIHRTHENCRDTFREYLSAMKDDVSAPRRLPAGMAAVMPPWAYETGLLK